MIFVWQSFKICLIHLHFVKYKGLNRPETSMQKKERKKEMLTHEVLFHKWMLMNWNLKLRKYVYYILWLSQYYVKCHKNTKKYRYSESKICQPRFPNFRYVYKICIHFIISLFKFHYKFWNRVKFLISKMLSK